MVRSFLYVIQVCETGLVGIHNIKLLGFIIIAFIAGTITSGAIAYADKDNNNPFNAIVIAIKNLTDAIKNKQTTVTVNAPQGPPGPPGTSVTVTPEPPGPNCANGGVKLTSVSGINYICNGGSSTSTCPAGQTNCAGVCKNLSTDPTSCGACGVACPSGSTCTSGVCACPAGQVICSGVCSNVSTDTHNCGACGNVCGAGQTCSAGVCSSATCPAGQTMCGGTCVNTSTDTHNCGACGLACNAANGVSACTAGACTISTCNAGFANCDQNAANGCEINTNTDTHNCGACGNVCPGISGGHAVCSGGACGTVCNPGLKDCGNGACVPISQICQ